MADELTMHKSRLGTIWIDCETADFRSQALGCRFEPLGDPLWVVPPLRGDIEAAATTWNGGHDR